MRATACTFWAIDPGNRCTAGGSEHSEANCSGSAAAMSDGVRLPNRSRIFAGPRNACSMGYCWSSSMPRSNANGEPSRTSSAFSSPVMWMAIQPSCQPLWKAPSPLPVLGQGGTVHDDLAAAITHELRVFVAGAGTRRALPTTCYVGHPLGEQVRLVELAVAGQPSLMADIV